MSNYAERTTPPRCLTPDEQTRLLRVSGEHRAGFRDHCIFAVALWTGLREHEIAALDIGDVSPDGERTRRWLKLRVFKGCGRAEGPQEIQLSDPLRYKLEKYLELGDGLYVPQRPLFLSRRRSRLSTRQLREIFATWQTRARFERRYSFHALRHTFCTNVYQASGRDVEQLQRTARHARVETSMRYVHSTDDERLASLNKLPG